MTLQQRIEEVLFEQVAVNGKYDTYGISRVLTQLFADEMKGVVTKETSAIIAKFDKYDKGPFARAFARNMLRLNSENILSALDT